MGKKITINEVAEQFDVSTRTVRRYIASGRLTAWRVGPRMIRLGARRAGEKRRLDVEEKVRFVQMAPSRSRRGRYALLLPHEAPEPETYAERKRPLGVVGADALEEVVRDGDLYGQHLVWLNNFGARDIFALREENGPPWVDWMD